MTDWKSIAAARAPEIPAEEAERVAATLAALEQTFRPLARDLPPDLEPAGEFRAEDSE